MESRRTETLVGSGAAVTRMPINQAVALVGGLGTRLCSLTQSTPKPLLDVSGRPFLLHLIDEIRRHGVPEIVLLAGFQADQVRAAVSGQNDVTVLVEPEPMGTGGALVFARDLLAEQFFFLNGDSLFDVNLWDLALAHRGVSMATLALRSVEDASRYGCALFDGERITGFRERGDPGPGYINGGVGILDRSILELLPPAGYSSIEALAYPELARTGRLGGRGYDRPFIDIGVPDELARASIWVSQHLSRGAVIFDRDGVLNADIGYAHRPEHITWIEGAIRAVKTVNDAGLFAFVATNQAGVAHGYYDDAQVYALHGWMNETLATKGAHIDTFVYSPYHPQGAVEAYRRTSDCRKPGPRMLTDLLMLRPVDRTRTIMIGDKPSDMQAAAAAGLRGVRFEGGDLAAVIEPLVRDLSQGVQLRFQAEQL